MLQSNCKSKDERAEDDGDMDDNGENKRPVPAANLAKWLKDLFKKGNSIDVAAQAAAVPEVRYLNWAMHFPKMVLVREFKDMTQKVKTCKGNIELQAQWATESWKSTIAEIMGQLSVRGNMQKLGLLTGDTAGLETSFLADEFYKTVVWASDNRATSMSIWSAALFLLLVTLW